MKKLTNPYVTETILEVVENQLRDLDPPETKETYDRLVASGFSDDQARRLIAAVLLDEISRVLKHTQTYNPERYIASLKKLPKLP